VKRATRVPVEGLQEGEWLLPGAAGHYVARVLRRARGDRLVLFDPGAGLEADAEVQSVDGARVTVLSGAARPAAQIEREVILIQAVGKGDKLDAVVQDATELGATRIVPVLSERTVVQPGAKASARVERWRRIASEAARQCGRARAPTVDELAPLLPAAAAIQGGLRLALAPGAGALAGPLLLGEAGSVAFVVGPEGGLTEGELRALEGDGWIAASLGPATLRTETVAAAVLGALRLGAP
jgi:16S rRNA (uracil1498-N3)-methyltransferase